MYYQVGPCTDDVIYEKRTYRCIGQWIDDKGVLYSYTKRIDTIPSYECFVGAETSLGTKKIFIKEAGESCHKHINPFQLGMEMDQLSEFVILMKLSIGIDSIIIQIFIVLFILQGSARATTFQIALCSQLKKILQPNT